VPVIAGLSDGTVLLTLTACVSDRADTKRTDGRIVVDDLRNHDVAARPTAAIEMLDELALETVDDRRNQHRMLDRQVATVCVRRHRGTLERMVEIGAARDGPTPPFSGEAELPELK
jgi:hypothetical protein